MKDIPFCLNKIPINLLQGWWEGKRTVCLVLASAVMLCAAFFRLKYEIPRLLFDEGALGAIDLRIFHEFVHAWFSGLPVYGTMETANYPPASFLILWPLVGWVSETGARWLWAVSALMAFASIAFFIIKGGCSDYLPERLFIILFLLSVYPTNVTIGNGQLIIHLVALLLVGTIVLQRKDRDLKYAFFSSVAFLVALVKPTVTVPFLWLLLFVPKGRRSFLLVVSGYLSLTILACIFRPGDFLQVINAAITQCLHGAASQAELTGYANVHSWLVFWGLERLMLPASLTILALLGIWIHRHRDADLWLLLGVTALAARVWTHHPVYEDLLVVLPLVSLLRIIRRGSLSDEAKGLASVLIAVTSLGLLVPATLRLFPSPWKYLFTVGQAAIWLSVLIFLLNLARTQKKALRCDG